jgi:hypothetical protein
MGICYRDNLRSWRIAVKLHHLQSSLLTEQSVYEAQFADLEDSYKP